MPTITVSAADSATAMDQIIAQLGEDAMIIDTTTKDGKLEIRATNDVALMPRKPKKVSDVFTQIMQDELSIPEAGDKARSAQTPPGHASGPVLEKAKADAFWKKVEGNEEDEPRGADELKERETEISIRMRRLQWENKRLAKESDSLKELSREAVATARNYLEKSEQHHHETNQRLNGFRDELTSLREMINEKKLKAEKKSSRRRFALIVLAGFMGVAAGAYTIKDRSEILLPWVDTFMSTIGATVNVSMDYFKVSDLEAVRLGDIIRAKGMVTNTYPLSADAPVIRFMVKDEKGSVLAERDVAVDMPSLRPGQPTQVSVQLELARRLDDNVVTDIVAVPVKQASPLSTSAGFGA
jgi:hypothetical protein